MKQELIKEIETLRSPVGYLYAGVPKFQGLFGRDALISAWQLLKYDPSIAKKTLVALSEVQGDKVDGETSEEPGKIPHEYYPDYTDEGWYDTYKKEVRWLKKGKPVYFSIDSTLWFVIVLAKYYKKTWDDELLIQLWPNARKALDWVFDYGLNEGFLKHKKLNPKDGLDSQSWKDGIDYVLDEMEGELAIVEVQGYTYYMLNCGAYLAQVLGERSYAKKLKKTAKKLKINFQEKFWDQEKDYFIFGLDSRGKKIRSVMSNAGHLLFTGIMNNEEEKLIVKRLFAPDMWTPYGIRTHSTKEPEFNPYAYQLGSVWPHDNWIIAQGLKDRGYVNEYQKVKRALKKVYEEIKRVPEFYGVTIDNQIFIEGLIDRPCHPQAWSSGAMLDLVSGNDLLALSQGYFTRQISNLNKSDVIMKKLTVLKTKAFLQS